MQLGTTKNYLDLEVKMSKVKLTTRSNVVKITCSEMQRSGKGILPSMVSRRTPSTFTCNRCHGMKPFEPHKIASEFPTLQRERNVHIVISSSSSAATASSSLLLDRGIVPTLRQFSTQGEFISFCGLNCSSSNELINIPFQVFGKPNCILNPIINDY